MDETKTESVDEIIREKGENISQRIGDLVEGKVECANVSTEQMRRLLESPVELVAFFCH